MGSERDDQKYFAFKRKGLIYLAALAILAALLACSQLAGSNLSPTATPAPTEGSSGQAAGSAASANTPTAASTASNKSSESLPASVDTTAELNVRTGPDTNCPEIGTFAAGTQVEVLAKDPSGKWWQVTYQDQIGWMSASYTTPVTDLSGVQTIPGPACDTPVPPTSTPTNTSIPPTATSTATATSSPTCGDGVVNGSEECDGTAGSCGLGSFCNDSCQCQLMNIQPISVCGNGTVEGGEQCDSSNAGCGIGQFCNDSCACQNMIIQPVGP